MILADTNLLSETVRQSPDPKVADWLDRNEYTIWLPTIVIAELRYGVEKLPASRKKTTLTLWLAALLKQYEERIAPFDGDAAEAHGKLCARLKRRGETMPLADSYLAAIAHARGAAIATRNVDDFRHAEIDLIDPWAIG